MFVKLVFVDFPGVQLPLVKQELCELAAGGLGDSLHAALATLKQDGKLHGLTSIAGVLTGGGVPLDASAKVSDHMISQGGTRVGPSAWTRDNVHDNLPLVPSLTIKGNWNADAVERRAPLVAPVQPKLFSQPLVISPELVDLIALDSPRGRQVTVPKRTEPVLSLDRLARVRVYFSSALVEGFGAGDPDYIDALVHGLRQSRIDATRIVNDTEESRKQLQLCPPGALTLVSYGEATTKLEASSKAVAATYEHIVRCQRREPTAVHILHIQMRLPASGSAFADPAAIQMFTRQGIRVVLTLHEFRYNLRNPDDPIHNATMLECCRVADRVVLLNLGDIDEALATVVRGSVVKSEKIKGGGRQLVEVAKVASFDLKAKVRHIPVAITVPAPGMHQAWPQHAGRAREVRIALFGMIRMGKGDRAAVELARLIKKRGLAWRVVVAGKATHEATVKSLLEAAFGKKIQVWPKGEREQRDCVAKLMAARELEAIAFERALAAYKLVAARLVADYQSFKRDNERLLRELSKEEASVARKDVVQWGEIEAARKQLGALQRLAKAPEWPCLPIDVHVNLTPTELNDLLGTCSYSYKNDEKGMADNASSIVSAMANGCITFTSLGNLTPIEFRTLHGNLTLAEFQEVQLGALLGEQRAMRERGIRIYPTVGGKHKLEVIGLFDGAVLAPDGPDAEATPEFVVDQIEQRERTPLLNQQTRRVMREALMRRFLPLEIARRHCLVYQELTPK